ncbi:MAG: hypothetical protein ACE5K7_04085, partial [Phycisphaerae bacterium]
MPESIDTSIPLGELYWRSLVAAFDGQKACFDRASGRFLSRLQEPPKSPERPDVIGWAVTHQDVILPLAVLYTTGRPDNALYHSDELLEMIIRGGNAIRNFQQPDGQVEFVKPDGSCWGPTYMGWTNYHWLETYALLRDHLPDDVLRSWQQGLSLAHEGQRREIENGRIHNIPTWKAVSCWRAGQLFGNDRWQRAAERYIERVIAAQHPGGFWPEHRGPTTSYNRVDLHALGLYWIFTGQPRALEAVQRAVQFHLIHSYPDGTDVETIDGRVKYRPARSAMGLVGLGLTPQGRRLARCLMQPCSGVEDLTASCTPHMASAFLHAPDGPEQPGIFNQAERVCNWQQMSLTLRSGPWFACCSAIVVPPIDNVWGQNRQHFFSLWADGAGLLIGRGNSRNQPAWSTFVVCGPTGRRYLPDQARLLDDGVQLHYGPTRCTLQVALQPDQARIGASVGGTSQPARLQLQLPLRPATKLQCPDGTQVELTGQAASTRRIAQPAGRLSVGPGLWSIELPRPWSLDWPVRPFNP